jgi:UDP-N-acetyl-alpha-D-muramoyl-L-alanyl-L-glutamate epimerase
LSLLKNQSRFHQLRRQYPFFVFQSYSIQRKNGSLKLKFNFNLANHFVFEPVIRIPARQFYNWESLPDETLEQLVFHIGMVELVSYWKLACPPQVIIKPFALDAWQIDWWKKLYFNGLGEFFYLNGIEINQEEFMVIEAVSDKTAKLTEMPLGESILVPVGGGKDSVVSLELLKRNGAAFTPFIVNPRTASLKCAETAGFNLEQTAIVERSLDPLLIELNAKGFLNGHTPFSALLAFVSALVAIGSGHQYIALSNESSANEATVANTQINHQYSKSLEFEDDFRAYSKTYMHAGLEYFSLLRPLNELQIARIFSKQKQYFAHFKSCNVGSKTDSWCCNCPKCLFTWLMLSPYLKQEELVKIFGEDLLKKEQLRLFLDQLTGHAETKPFECVGTLEEVNTALAYLISEHQANDLPALLQGIKPVFNSADVYYGMLKLTGKYEVEHRVPEWLMQTIKAALHA